MGVTCNGTAKPKIDSEATDGRALESVTGTIELRDVHFRYPTRPTVRGVNLTVELVHILP